MHSLYRTTFTTMLLAASHCAFADAPDNTAQKITPTPQHTPAADIRVNRSWDVFVTANFIYWEASQDNMELAIESLPATNQSNLIGKVINNNLEYKPGFQVGLGFGTNYDGWNSELTYTWFRSTTTTHHSVNSDGSHVLWPLWLTPQAFTFHSASEKWKLTLDAFDWTLGRTSLLGKRFTLRPFFGLRSTLLKQQIQARYNHAFLQTSVQNLFYDGSSHSWGIGPEVGLGSRWLLGGGFKLYGDLELDLLYTRYTKLNSKEHKQIGSASPFVKHHVTQHNLNVLRPHCDTEIGVSWGSYCGTKNMHLELMLGYEFQIFWNQLMCRKFVDDTEKGSSTTPNGDLYLQGLTASVRFDF